MHLQLVKVFYPSYEVVLQIKDLEVGAHVAQQLNLLNVLLMEGHLLQAEYQPLIVLRPLH